MTEQTLEHPPQEHDFDRMAREIGIPPCPAILSRFSAEMHEPEPDTRKLAALIGMDIALSAALLKFVNSPFYGLRTRATNAHQALSIIGLRAGANLITGLVLRSAFPPGSGPLMQRFWDNAGRAAAATLSAARSLEGINVDEAHTYALFRDCGIAVMVNRFPDYARTFDSMERVPGAQVVAAEETRYRYSHARVGYALARGWLLPEPLCRAILYHHDFENVAARRRDVEPADPKLVALGLLIEQIAAFRGGAVLCPDWPSGEKFVLRTLAITPEQIIALAQRHEQEAD